MKKRENDTAGFRLLYLKELLGVKLTLIVLVCASLQVSARLQDKISINLQSADLKTALTVIERTSTYHFLYNEAVIANKPKVDIIVKDAEITTVLDRILVVNGIDYRILNNNLVVLKAAGDNTALDIPEIRVSGKVTGANGAPLAGVSITIKGASGGTTTDDAGNFSIVVPSENSVLVFSYVGYGPQEIVVGNKTTIDVALVASVNQLDQVVVVGYGTQRKIDVTGSVSQVRGEEINKQPVQNPISALQGKVAGVQITNSGAPGASPEIRIRGLGTVYGSANPLYVVDGVWFNDISFLNPGDIESINILKDASSESIYGIRAANGVVLITTKKGRGSKPNVNYNGYVGWQTVTNEMKLANGTEYATMVNELRNINGSPSLLDPSKYGEGTDWNHQILRSALITNHQVSLNGGGNASTYNFSLGYLNQDGIVEKNNYTRYTARLQNDIQVVNPLKIGYTVTGAYSKSTDIPGSIFHEIYSAAPIVPVYYADGTYGDPSDYNLGGAVTFNPQVTLDYYDQKSQHYRINGAAYANLKFARHFTLNSSIGGDFAQDESNNYLPVYTATLTQRNTTSMLTINRGETRNWIVENTLTYQNKINDHNITVLAGQGAQRNKFYSYKASAPNVPNSSEGDHYISLGTAANVNAQDAGNLFTVASYFGRVNYSFRNRYLLNASIRADGSSQFSESDRWGYFPSVGVGWVITQEDFMKDQQIFNNLKVRGSWGKIGNSSIPFQPSTLTVSQDQYLTAFFGRPSLPYTGATINRIVPPTTIWEKSEGTDVAVEMSLLKNRLYFEADWYDRKTKDAIFDIPILNSLGTTSGRVIGNQATIENRGIEFTATWKDVLSKAVSYSLSGNIGINNNKVLSTSTGANPIYDGGQGITGGALSTRTVVGEPIGQFYGLQVAGIFQNQGQVDDYKDKNGIKIQPSAKPGDFIYVDQNNDGAIDGKDRIALGNPNPKYTYGINTNWTYKNFDLTLDFQGVAGVDIYNANLGFRFGNENFLEEFYKNRWHGEGTSNYYPSANIGGGNNYVPNSFYVEDGSYFRIRNMQLGYTLPMSTAQKIRAKSLRVYANAQNAFNFFKYRGLSPEITGGNPTSRGIDVNVYPLSATYNFGVNVSF
ncbi:MAG: SusC/RagA family TonB-linked outer membrane protein [Flavisolibacter sp.]